MIFIYPDSVFRISRCRIDGVLMLSSGEGLINNNVIKKGDDDYTLVYFDRYQPLYVDNV